jgi:hypothetical protein
VLTGPLDARVRDRVVAETRGNPLALLELPTGLMPAELLVAAADPTGDPGLVWRAAGLLAIGAEAAVPTTEAGLVEFGAWVTFRHPLVRMAAYRSASPLQRQDAHRALAEVTDPRDDPDRRAWHRAQAAAGPDEDVAGELERSAGRAQARGGLAAAASFLERAALLTPEPARRAQRLLAAARTKHAAGALDAALGLLVAVEAGPSDPLRTAEVERLRGQIATQQRRSGDGARLLLSAARRLERLDAALARETYMEALAAAVWAGDLGFPGGVRAAAEAARAAPRAPEPPRVVDVLLDAFALRLTEGFAVAAPALTRALDLVLALDAAPDLEAGHWLWPASAGQMLAQELWNAEGWYVLAAHVAQFARDTGALVLLQFGLIFLVVPHLLAGELATAARLIEEDRLIAEATGNPPVAYTAMTLARARSSTTWARSSPSSASTRAASSTGSCPATRRPSRRTSPAVPVGRSGHDWPLALSNGGYEHGPPGLTMAGRPPG